MTFGGVGVGEHFMKCHTGEPARLSASKFLTSAISELLVTEKHCFALDEVKILAKEPEDFARKRNEKSDLNRDEK